VRARGHVEPAGLPGIYASPSAPPPWRPGYCTYVPGFFSVHLILLTSANTRKFPPPANFNAQLSSQWRGR